MIFPCGAPKRTLPIRRIREPARRHGESSVLRLLAWRSCLGSKTPTRRTASAYDGIARKSLLSDSSKKSWITRILVHQGHHPVHQTCTKVQCRVVFLGARGEASRNPRRGRVRPRQRPPYSATTDTNGTSYMRACRKCRLPHGEDGNPRRFLSLECRIPVKGCRGTVERPSAAVVTASFEGGSEARHRLDTISARICALFPPIEEQ